MFYAVKIGLAPGIYTSWDDCKKNVNGFKNAKYKKFKTNEEALCYMNEPLDNIPIEKVLKRVEIDISGKTIYHVFTDGSCINNGKDEAKGGIGIHFHENIHEDISEPLEGIQTNNRAELTAIIKTYEIIETLNNTNTVYYLYTDSEYCINCITKYCEIWENNNWKKKGGEIKNLDLIQLLWKLYNKNNNIIFEHIRSHTGKTDFKSKGNEIADKLANKYSNV